MSIQDGRSYQGTVTILPKGGRNHTTGLDLTRGRSLLLRDSRHLTLGQPTWRDNIKTTTTTTQQQQQQQHKNNNNKNNKKVARAFFSPCGMRLLTVMCSCIYIYQRDPLCSGGVCYEQHTLIHARPPTHTHRHTHRHTHTHTHTHRTLSILVNTCTYHSTP